MRKTLALLAGAALVVAACSTGSERVVVAAGTTIVDSGFIEALIDEYPGDGSFSIVAASSREGFALADGGAADMLFTHLAEVEDEYVAAHPDAWQSAGVREPVPRGWAAGTDRHPTRGRRGGRLLRHCGGEAPFVSRGDGSGYGGARACDLGSRGIEPAGQPWYIETGQGMGFTLQVTDQRDAFTLVEGGSFFAEASVLSLEEVAVTASPDELLSNPYRMTLVDPSADRGRTGSVHLDDLRRRTCRDGQGERGAVRQGRLRAVLLIDRRLLHDPEDEPPGSQPVEARNDVVHRDPHSARQRLGLLHTREDLEDVGEACNHDGDEPRPPREPDCRDERACDFVDHDPARVGVVSGERSRRPE